MLSFSPQLLYYTIFEKKMEVVFGKSTNFLKTVYFRAKLRYNEDAVLYPRKGNDNTRRSFL